ncbi:MAG: flagellar hook-length control protein FliK [Methylophaga sp.]|nr:flagellar hook-length control protein FliK [Methylophaga sp.]
MIIPQSNKNHIGLVQDIPKTMLVEKVIGQRIEARVMQAAVAAEMVSIKVADRVLQLRTPVDLQAGQKIQLEWVEQSGKLVLKLVTAAENNQKLLSSLQVGQQLPVEILKVLAQGRVLVQTLAVQTSLNSTQSFIQQFDIDISQLSKQFKLGDKLMMDIISVKPLNIRLQSNLGHHQIVNRLQQLLGQQALNPSLAGLISSLQNKTIPEAMQSAISNLVQFSLDKTAVTQLNSLKQAMSLSGTFSENKLLNQPTSSNQDFKANLVKVLAAIETVMSQVRGSESGEKINKLPAQVLSALASQGKTVEQLLHVLLSGKNSASPAAVQSLLPGLLNKEQALLLTQILSQSGSTNAATAGRQTPLNLAELMVMFKEVEGVYNKVQLNQLLMLREGDNSTTTTASWLFDIPIKDKQNLDLLHMQIDQHKKESEQDDEIWNVQLRLDTQNLGPVQATVTLVDEDVKVVFRAERNQSAALLEDNMDMLIASLNAIGVTSSHMSCVSGNVAEATIMDKHNQIEAVSRVDISV